MDLGQVQAQAHAAALGHLECGDGKATLGDVVCSGQAFVAHEEVREALLVGQVHLRRQTIQTILRLISLLTSADLLPDGAAKFILGLTQQHEYLRLLHEAELVADGLVDVIDNAEDAHDGRRQDRLLAGLVVEGDVAAGDRDAEFHGAVGKPMHGLAELPHHVRVFRGAVVEAVGNGHRAGTGDGDVAVGLRQRQAGAHVRVQLGVATRGIGRYRDTAAGLLVDAQHTSVRVVGLHGVAAHVAVVLVGDEITRAQRRGGHELLQRHGEVLLLDALELLQRILPLRAGIGAVVDRGLVRDGAGRGVHDDLALVADNEVLASGNLTDLGAGDVPMRADLLELFHVLRGHHGAHALLGLGGEDLCSGHILCAQRDVVQVDLHAAITGGGQLGGGAGQARTAQVLDAHDDAGLVQLQAALDENLLRERVTHLHGRQLALGAVLEGVRSQHGHATDAVEAGARTEEHDLVAGTGGKSELEVLHLQRAHAQRVDQRVARIGLIKNSFAANVGQAQAVAVVGNTADNTGQNALGVGRISRAEA